MVMLWSHETIHAWRVKFTLTIENDVLALTASLCSDFLFHLSRFGDTCLILQSKEVSLVARLCCTFHACRQTCTMHEELSHRKHHKSISKRYMCSVMQTGSPHILLPHYSGDSRSWANISQQPPLCCCSAADTHLHSHSKDCSARRKILKPATQK